MTTPTPLNADAIQAKITPKALQTAYEIEIFEQLDSTNTYLQQVDKRARVRPLFCLAEEQTQGKGRFEREWHSPAYQNIYLSCAWEHSHTPPPSLSIVIALAVVRALKTIAPTITFQIKWPNDLWANGKKCGGILIETQRTALGLSRWIIGIGINVNMIDNAAAMEAQWTSLQKITGIEYDRNAIVAALIQNILTTVPPFLTQGLRPWQNEWQALDALYQQPVSAKHDGNTIQGTAMGIDEQGYLRVQVGSDIVLCSSAETTLRS